MADDPREILSRLLDERRAQARACLPVDWDFVVGRANGCLIYDEVGSPFFDFGPGAQVHLLGHNNEQVIGRMHEHLHYYTYTGEHLTRFGVEYAAALSSRFDTEMQVLVVPGVYEARWIASQLGACDPADEIETGFGRTGRLWEHQHYDQSPDLVLLGPSGAAGMPFAAVVARPELMARAQIPPMAVHPLVCAAASVVLEHMTDQMFVHVREMGHCLYEGVLEVATQFPHIVKEPGHSVGLIQNIEIIETERTQQFREACRTKGLILHPDLHMTPPLVITEKEVGQAVDILADVCLDWR